MPPKAKKPGKDVKAATANEADILRKQLQSVENRLQEEAMLRNEAHVERDMLLGFLNIARSELDTARADMRANAHEAQHVAQQHDIEVKTYKQKIKHLLFEHQHNMAAVKADAEQAVQAARQGVVKQQDDAAHDVRTLHTMLREQALEHEEVVIQLKSEHAKQLSKQRLEFEEQVTALEATAAARLRALREADEQRARAAASAMDAAHAEHVAHLVAQHDQAVKDMQAYYNDVVRSNLDVIKALKQQLADASTTASGAVRAAAAAEAVQVAMAESLTKAQEKVKALEGVAHGAARDRASLRRTTKQLTKTSNVLKSRELQLEALQQDHEALQARYDALSRQNEMVSLEGRRLAALHLQAAWARVAGVLGGFRASLPDGRWESVRDAVQDAMLGATEPAPCPVDVL